MMDADLLELPSICDIDDDPHEYIATAECRKRTIHALRSMRGSAKVYEKLVALRDGIRAVDEFGDPVATDLIISHAIDIEDLDIDMVHSVAALAFHDVYENAAKTPKPKPKPARYFLPTSTRDAVDWLVVHSTAERLRKFLDGRSREELKAINEHLARPRKVAA
jgi:hypothetical protein